MGGLGEVKCPNNRNHKTSTAGKKMLVSDLSSLRSIARLILIPRSYEYYEVTHCDQSKRSVAFFGQNLN